MNTIDRINLKLFGGFVGLSPKPIDIEILKTWSTKRLLRYYRATHARVRAIIQSTYCDSCGEYHLDDLPSHYKEFEAYALEIKSLLDKREHIK